jgi:hypothetical protein
VSDGQDDNIMSLAAWRQRSASWSTGATVTGERARADAAYAEPRHGGAARDNATAVPRLLAALCICRCSSRRSSGDPLRSLFIPLTLGVGFAMISSHVLSEHVRADPVRDPAQAPRGAWRGSGLLTDF